MLGGIEYFVSPSVCSHLKELIAKHSDVAIYRDQVVAHGREFLQSEYEACVKIEEIKSCKEIYVTSSASMVSINTTA